jgi:hypothetical protein
MLLLLMLLLLLKRIKRESDRQSGFTGKPNWEKNF